MLKFHNFDFAKKILYHPRKIANILEDKYPFPVNVEIDLSNICNHKCIFCNVSEYISKNRVKLEEERVIELLSELHSYLTM